MYAEIKNGAVVKFPYGFEQLQADNPYTKFDTSLDVKVLFEGTETNLAGSELVDVTTEAQPTYDEATQNCSLMSNPELVNGNWVLSWVISPKTDAEKAEYVDKIKNDNKSKAVQLLQQTDWVELPSVTNITNVPHLVNFSDFLSYRNLLRSIAVNPPSSSVELWPTLPAEQWST